MSTDDAQSKFHVFAENLFRCHMAPTPSSMKLLKIDVNNQDECGILYELFSYGYRRKAKEFLTSDDKYKQDIANDPSKLFDFITEYIKATGYVSVLQGLDKDDDGNLSNIRMSFNSLE